ncbi:polyhydroxyalkanoate granule-associated phasin [Paracidovorax oryzae]|uniref:polyhydroxyalkanoate granule-associated phasin n=1 Tax=Paracidovorax oryzae TaxID=862720 RepID=UPI0003180ED9|nr:polyhydroxyalkanoate granule-associated phasin [Paracidovorax oryzae]
MPGPSSRRNRSLARQGAELAMAVPPVVAHRVARMALAGPNPSQRDRREFGRMVAEKQWAFVQSWAAMGMQALLAQQAMAASMVRLGGGGPPPGPRHGRHPPPRAWRRGRPRGWPAGWGRRY